ncbi:DUF3987 domain-containing protein [Bacteroides caecigallinarum]|uniref:DUF3987 domain-containing protein n=1 Tax=Bacteroides caecigallinarum TaxID=1411144 RepID=UPI00195DD773|nr:DUF3987 domain-containing protein [Bacteroides caecigallinarum]MBM6890193.1 DUF3987 domain-containing protein [Bacteroides caecigallinarum]
MKITIFSSLMTKEAEGVIDATEWIRDIRDGKFKPTVDQVRSMIKLGDKDRVRDWKMKLPAAVWAGECRKGRFFKHTTVRTGYAIFDFDNLRDDQLRAARQLLEVFPWIVAVHVTASGRGLRVVVNIGIVHIDVYRQAYEQVAECLHEITGLELDMACKDFARASLASYDPEIYYNPKATVFPYGEEHNPLNYMPATGPDPSEDFHYLNNPVAQALSLGCQSEGSNRNQAAQGYSGSAPDVDDCINRFFYNNTYVQGSRTRTMLKLGLYLRWRGVQSWQLDHAIHVACARGVQPGITPKEIERAIRWGYEHGEEGGKMPEKRGQRDHNYNINACLNATPVQMPDTKIDKEDKKDENEVIDETCGPIPGPIFSTLPQSLKNLLVIAKNDRERDVILLSCITILSGIFHSLRTMYGNKKYSAHLYMCFLAGSGSGKGVAMYATLLGKPIHNELVKRNKAAKREFENKLVEWELELKAASKEKRKPNMDLRPEDVERDILYLQANTSKSQMLHEMAGSQKHGNILPVSEIDEFSESLQTKYGKHAAEIRMYFHHERVGQSFKNDKEPVEIENPRLALMMSGTPQQLVNFIRTIEDGMFSRFLFYVMGTNYKWISQSPLDGNGNIDVEELFSPLAQMLKEHFFNTIGQEITINFTREQWDKHTSTFQAQLGMVVAEDTPDITGVIFRTGLIVLRVAMVLCGLRILESGWQIKEYTCTDEDFDTAMKIVLTCMNHTLNTSTMMEEGSKRHKLTNYYKLLPVLRKMNNRFKYSEFKLGANDIGIGDTSVKRALKKYIITGLITKHYEGYEKTFLGKTCI